MLGRRKTAEEKAWLKEHASEAPADEIIERFTDEFGWSPKKHALQVWVSKNGLHFGLPKRASAGSETVRCVRWSQEPEMESWMLEHDRGQTTRELSAAFEIRFGFPLSRSQISLFRSSHGTQVKRSHGGGKPSAPVGAERTNKDGYVKVKVRESPTIPQSKDNWRFKHHLVWEQTSGRELPPGWTVIFINGDIHDFRPENLYALPRAHMAQLNAVRPEGGWPDRETLEAAVSLCKLNSAVLDAKNRSRRCAHCGRMFTPDPANRYSGQNTCRQCLDAGHKAPTRRAGSATCEKYGRTYERWQRRQRFCSDCSTARSRRRT